MNKDGHQLSLNHTSTDSPLLPAENLRQLKEINPDIVDWVLEQTVIEAQSRRGQERRVEWFIFIERMSGVLMGGFIAALGFVVGAYLIINGHDWAGVTLCGTTLTTIVAVLVTKEFNKKASAQKVEAPTKATPRKPRNKKILPPPPPSQP